MSVSHPPPAPVRPLSEEERARVLSKLDALRDRLLFEPGTEPLQAELDAIRFRAGLGHLFFEDVPRLVELFERYSVGGA